MDDKERLLKSCCKLTSFWKKGVGVWAWGWSGAITMEVEIGGTDQMYAK